MVTGSSQTRAKGDQPMVWTLCWRYCDGLVITDVDGESLVDLPLNVTDDEPRVRDWRSYPCRLEAAQESQAPSCTRENTSSSSLLTTTRSQSGRNSTLSPPSYDAVRVARVYLSLR